MKIWHPEPLARGRFLHATIHCENRQAAIPTPPLLAAATHRPPPTSHCHPPATGSKRAWETFSRPNRTLSCWRHTWQKKTKKKKQNSKTLNPQPVKSFSTPHYTEKTGGLPYSQTLALNLLRRCRQTGLDAQGVTPELLRLKFYCS
jgi:hypothetical protein